MIICASGLAASSRGQELTQRLMMAAMSKAIAGRFLIILLLGGCGTELVDRTECVGYYIINRTTLVDVIDLMPDGQYAHYYIDPKGNCVQDLNRWKFDTTGGNSSVVLDEWYESYKGSSSGHEPMTRSFPVDRSSNKVRLTVSDDLGQYYYFESPDWQKAERAFDSLADIFFGTRPASK